MRGRVNPVDHYIRLGGLEHNGNARHCVHAAAVDAADAAVDAADAAVDATDAAGVLLWCDHMPCFFFLHASRGLFLWGMMGVFRTMLLMCVTLADVWRPLKMFSGCNVDVYGAARYPGAAHLCQTHHHLRVWHVLPLGPGGGVPPGVSGPHPRGGASLCLLECACVCASMHACLLALTQSACTRILVCITLATLTVNTHPHFLHHQC